MSSKDEDYYKVKEDPGWITGCLEKSRNSRVPIWESRKTCWLSPDKQGTPAWKQQRIGRIRASIISEICDRVNRGPKIRTRTCTELARVVCGLEPESTTPDRELAMMDGIVGEPLVRDWYARDILKRDINEVGLAIWKEDPYFGASLDGETKTEYEDAAIEIKIPEKLNQKFINVFQSWGRDLNNPHPETYLFSSHYDQITAGSVITGKDGCYYVVACLRSRECFHQYINTDYELWNKILYPTAKKFWNKHIYPLLKEHNIKVVMPPQLSYESSSDELAKVETL